MNDWRAQERVTILYQLQKLRETEKRYRPFVVITDPKTGKYVQFVGSKTEPILLDLPTSQILSEKELGVAQKLLGTARAVKAGPRSPKAFQVFQAGPFEEMKKAADCALDVLEKVLRAKGHELRVDFGLTTKTVKTVKKKGNSRERVGAR